MNFTSVNITTTAANSVGTLVQYVFYVIIGSLATPGNLLVIITILRAKSLRENFLLQAALASGDMITGFAYLSSGAMRISYWLQDLLGTTTSQIDCMLRLYFPFFIVGHQIVAIVEVLIAIDRTIAVAAPVVYFTLPKKRMTTIAVLIGYFACAISLVAAYLVTLYGPNGQIAYACTGTSTYGPAYNLFNFGASVLCGSTASIILFSTILILRIQNRRLAGNELAKNRLLRQAKLTKLMVFVAAMMILFYVIPSAGDIVMGELNNASFTVIASPTFGNLICIHSVVNVVIYTGFSTELRTGFMATLKLMISPCYRKANTPSAYPAGLVSRGYRQG